jgi:hypothetical protein
MGSKGNKSVAQLVTISGPVDKDIFQCAMQMFSRETDSSDETCLNSHRDSLFGHYAEQYVA